MNRIDESRSTPTLDKVRETGLMKERGKNE